jgi:hypothetical protein
MCCEGFHDSRAKLDVPGQVRFVTVCAVCGREQLELSRQPYIPDPRLDEVAPGGAAAGGLPVPAIAA